MINLFSTYRPEFFLVLVIQVALASGEGPFIDIVRQAQLGIELPNVQSVDAKGSQLQPDGLHLTAQAQVRLGELLADAYFKTLPHPIPSNAERFFLKLLLSNLGILEMESSVKINK